jgi:hypothetical protein
MDKAAHLERYGRPGIPWRGVTITTWIAVLLCLVAFAISSRTVGRAVWWLGPTGDSAPLLYKIVPIALVVLPIEGAIWRSRTTIPAAVLCSLGLIAIALPDLSRSPGIAIGIVVVGIAALLQSIALVLVTRQYR